MNNNDVIEFLNKSVDKSGDIIRKYFRNLDNIDLKDDQSPVTIADREAEKALRDWIKAQFPEHGIYGEEFGRENESAEYQWIIDPIDGTSSFMIGRPIFGTLLGLLQNGAPIAGVIDQPITNDRWIATKGEGAYFNGKKTSVRKCDSIKSAIIATTSPDYFGDNSKKMLFNIAKQSKHMIYGGDCYSYALIASGTLDAVIDADMQPYDYLPLVTIVQGSGGIITDWQGRELNGKSNGNVIAAGDSRVHREILEKLKKYDK